MTTEIIANFSTLIKLANELSKAKLTGDEELIKIASKDHDQYKQICFDADQVNFGINLF